MLKARRADRLEQRADAVEAGIVARHRGRDRVDVAGQHPALRRLGGGDAEHAGAGAEVEHAAQLAALEHLIEQQQAAAGGAVMAGAERQRRLDLDGDLVARHLVAVMGAVDHEPPGRHRHQPFQAGLDPILGGDGLERDRRGCGLAGHQRHQRADRGLVGGFGEIQRDVPGVFAAFIGRDRDLALVKAFGEPVHRLACGGFGADRKTGAVRGRGVGHRNGSGLKEGQGGVTAGAERTALCTGLYRIYAPLHPGFFQRVVHRGCTAWARRYPHPLHISSTAYPQAYPGRNHRLIHKPRTGFWWICSPPAVGCRLHFVQSPALIFAVS